MAKRFSDTDKWEDPFFADLPDKYKLTYLLLLDRCDPVGVWKVNKRYVNFLIGDIDWDAFISYMGDRIHQISEDKWWLTKFCDFQYGTLSEDSGSKPIISHVNTLKKHNLWILYTKGIHTLKEKEKEKVKEKEKHKYGEYKNVKLTDEQYKKLLEKFRETGATLRIKNLDEYKQRTGKKYKDDYLTILTFERNNSDKKEPGNPYRML